MDKKFDLKDMMQARGSEQSETAGREMARMVSAFYDELIRAEMPDEVVLALSNRYVAELLAMIGRNRQ